MIIIIIVIKIIVWLRPAIAIAQAAQCVGNPLGRHGAALGRVKPAPTLLLLLLILSSPSSSVLL